MKKHSRALWLVMLALAVMGLSSCSMVFDAGVAGTVTDDKGENGLPYVNVYLYMSEEDWKADKATYDNAHPDKWEATRFNQKTATNANGTFAFDKIVWKTASSDFGKEADQSQVWLIYHSDKYGLEAQKVNMTSESRNTATPMKMEDMTDTHTYTLEFQDENKNVINDASIHFNWSYEGKPGEDEPVTGYGTNGNSITVTYYKDAGVPTLKVWDVTSDREEADKKEWAVAGTAPSKEAPLEINGKDDAAKDKDQTTSDPIALKRNWYYVTIGGQLREDNKPIAGKITLAYNGETWSINTDSQLSNDGNTVIRENFAGLGNADTNAKGKRLVIFTDKPQTVKLTAFTTGNFKIDDAFKVSPYENYNNKILVVTTDPAPEA